MTALHYRALRIFKDQPENYRLAMTLKKEDKRNRKLFNPNSPFDFSILGESEMIHLFKLVDLKDDKAGKIKALINERNNLAHASGNIEINPEKKCEEYLRCLDEIQKLFLKSDRLLADEFLRELEEDEDIKQFFEIRFVSHFINEYDYENIIRIFLKQGALNKSQTTYLWSEIGKNS